MTIQKLKFFFLFVMILVFFPKQVLAVPTLQTTGSAGSLILTGALGVTVGASLFDVEFLDGTCAGVFGTCAASSFTFDFTGAEAASNALLALVFTDTGFNGLGDFDTDPDQTRGCEPTSSPNQCFVFTPYGIMGGIDGFVAFNRIGLTGAPPDDVGRGFANLLDDFGALSNTTWAKWTPAAAPVPEPGIIILTGSGLLALFGVQRRNKKKM